MNMKNPKTEVPYWDEGQTGKLYRWYQKGYWKKYLGKKYRKKQLNANND